MFDHTIGRGEAVATGHLPCLTPPTYGKAAPVTIGDGSEKLFPWPAEHSHNGKNPAPLQVQKARDFNAEARIQAGIVAWVRANVPDVLIFHCPNGGLRSKAEVAKWKWIGVVAGTPDLIVVAPGGHVFFLEVKTAEGRLSDSQREIFDRLAALGTPRAIVRSVDDVRHAFDVWNIPVKEASRSPYAGAGQTAGRAAA